MGDEWDQNPTSEQPFQDDLDKRIEEIRRKVIEGTGEAQMRIKRVVDKAGEFWQQTYTPLEPHYASSIEEERIRHLANVWSLGNWQLARDLGTYMEVVSWSEDEVWEVNPMSGDYWENHNRYYLCGIMICLQLQA